MSAAGWLVDALLASTLLMAAVLIARRSVRRAFGPQVAYALWALPALRLLLPPLPAGWWRAAAAAPITRAGETVSVLLVRPVATAAAAAPSWGLALAIVWGAGALAFLGWHIVRHHRFCRTVLRDAIVVERHGKVQVIASAAATGPLAFGICRQVVAFPHDVAKRFDADERALALAHELGHHRRRDLLANWAALVVLALHWFSPVAWASFRAFRADQELANDAAVLAACGAGARHAYGRAIVKAAAPAFGLSAACHLHSIADLKGRLKMLTRSHLSRRRLAAGSAAVTLLVAGGLGLTASSSAAERLRTTLQAPVVLPMALVQAAPPAAPTPPAAGQARSRRHVVVVRDGVTHSYDGADADRYIAEHRLPVPPAPPAAPTVTGMQCPGGATGPVVENRRESGRTLLIVCNNRIDATVRNANVEATRDQAFARIDMSKARASLALARAAIELDRTLSGEQRAQALDGIAQAEAELRDPANN